MDAIKNMLGMGSNAGPGRVTTAPWGSFKGTDAQLYTITNGGITAAVTDLGATLVQLQLPDKNGEVRSPRPDPSTLCFKCSFAHRATTSAHRRSPTACSASTAPT